MQRSTGQVKAMGAMFGRVTKRRSFPKSLALAAALLMVLAGALSSAAAADLDNGDRVWVEGKQGYGGTGLFPIYVDTPSDPSDPGEPDFFAYCIELEVPAEVDRHGVVGELTDFLGDNHFADPEVQGKVFWVLAHSYPALSLEEFGAAAGVPGISRNDAIEATQYAIWRYTDLDFDASWPWETADSEAAYWYLVNGANSNPGLTPGEVEVTVSIDAPTAPQAADSLVGPFVVHSNQPTVTVVVDPAFVVTDAAGNPVDVDAVVDGQELYLDRRGTTSAGSATVTVSAQGSGSMGRLISVPTTAGGTPTADDHAQTIILVAPATTRTQAQATVRWEAAQAAEPVIGTSLVDAADGDRVLPWTGGTAIDTVFYRNLTPGTEYTVVGELIDKSDGAPTGITASATFTPTTADGSIEVTFIVPEGYAGRVLVAYEELFEGTDTSGSPIAEHRDIDDPAPTITVADRPAESPENPVDDDPATAGGLPATGSWIAGGAVLAGMLAIAAGIGLLAIRRRGRETVTG